jgi:hypothetical protein
MSMVTQAIQTLDRNSQQERLKKLLIYACYDTWEEDAAALHSITMEELVQTTLSQNSTFRDLEALVVELVGTLTKPAEYAQVADVLLDTLEPLYGADGGRIALGEGQDAGDRPLTAGDGENTAWLGGAAEQSEAPQNFLSLQRRSAYLLQQSPQHIRLKKMLICLCRQTWENDNNRLDQVSWDTLLGELTQQFKHMGEVETATRSILKALSKPQTYSLVAQELLDLLSPLYDLEARPESRDQSGNTAFAAHATARPPTAASPQESPPRSSGINPPSPLSTPFIDPTPSGNFSRPDSDITTLDAPRLVAKGRRIRKRFVVLGVVGLVGTGAAKYWFDHFNPFHRYDICFDRTLSDDLVNYTPIRCSQTDKILGPTVGAPKGHMTFKDINEDGQLDYRVSSEEFWCRWGKSCPSMTETWVTVELGYTPTFTIIQHNTLEPK